jgi:hypothetical protein
MFSHFRENTLESVNETPSNDDDEPEMFKRAPWGRRRQRFWNRVKRIAKKVHGHVKKVHGHAKKVCKWVKYVPIHSKS